jgi:hypothetical protein
MARKKTPKKHSTPRSAQPPFACSIFIQRAARQPGSAMCGVRTIADKKPQGQSNRPVFDRYPPALNMGVSTLMNKGGGHTVKLLPSRPAQRLRGARATLNIGEQNDTSEPKGQELNYSARISLDRAQMRIDNRTVNLSPGMAVTVEIKTGSRMILSYLLSPLLRYQQESLRER